MAIIQSSEIPKFVRCHSTIKKKHLLQINVLCVIHPEILANSHLSHTATANRIHNSLRHFEHRLNIIYNANIFLKKKHQFGNYMHNIEISRLGFLYNMN